MSVGYLKKKPWNVVEVTPMGHGRLARWRKWKSCDVGEAKEGLENEQSSFSKAFSRFTYVIAHSPTLPSLYLKHSSFSNPSIASPTSQFILQPLFCFSYATSSSLNSPGELPMLQNLRGLLPFATDLHNWAQIAPYIRNYKHQNYQSLHLRHKLLT